MRHYVGSGRCILPFLPDAACQMSFGWGIPSGTNSNSVLDVVRAVMVTTEGANRIFRGRKGVGRLIRSGYSVGLP